MDIIQEISFDKSYEILSGAFYNMPDYVFDDFVMSDKGFFQKELEKIFKKNPDADEEDVAEQFGDWVDIKWKLKVLELNSKNFTKQNQKTMIQRKFGNANPNNVPNDEKRIEFQKQLAKKIKPGTNEPVIMLNKGNEYRLLEGWHRTMAILSLGNNGESDPKNWNKIKIKAWVGTSSSIKNVW
ncbi:MAG: hypothetical protein CBC02_008340 [Flavobacteriaceae bacterium TMED42]|nr:MAG: hypothetical protein CBC02_008340 [Flavobacteriaceae bacterium TMED42]